MRPDSDVYLASLVRSQNGRWVHADGSPYNMTGFVECWPAADAAGNETVRMCGKVVPYWWALVSPEIIDCATQSHFNAFHMRMGPTSSGPFDRPEVGGPYLPDGSWNAAWWALVHQATHEAGRKGAAMQWDLMDGWIFKHSVWGDIPAKDQPPNPPWTPEEVQVPA